jgi:integrase/recombinase XerD
VIEQPHRPARQSAHAQWRLYALRAYSGQIGFEIGAHALRATAATNALDHQADIAKVQEWLGHTNIATTRIY